MNQCNKACNPIVPSYKLTKDENGKPFDATSYKKMVVSLMYMVVIRPDLAYSVCLVARHMERLTEVHLDVLKWILSYLNGSVNLGMLYKRSDKMVLLGWSGSDYVGDSDDTKRTTRYVFNLGSGSISRSSKK